jgi:hypothetical protein
MSVLVFWVVTPYGIVGLQSFQEHAASIFRDRCLCSTEALVYAHKSTRRYNREHSCRIYWKFWFHEKIHLRGVCSRVRWSARPSVSCSGSRHVRPRLLQRAGANGYVQSGEPPASVLFLVPSFRRREGYFLTRIHSWTLPLASVLRTEPLHNLNRNVWRHQALRDSLSNYLNLNPWANFNCIIEFYS